MKGAYYESEENALVTKEEVNANYSKLMRILFESRNYFAVATHDSALIDEAISLGKNTKFEFQMLMGIRDELKIELIKKGFAVAEYIPYGSHWLPYSVRRIRERKRNLLATSKVAHSKIALSNASKTYLYLFSYFLKTAPSLDHEPTKSSLNSVALSKASIDPSFLSESKKRAPPM